MRTKGRTVEVWADVRCPWCWIGHRHLTAAMAAHSVGRTKTDSLRRRAFLLEPEGPERAGMTVREAALNDWGMTHGQWEQSRARIEGAGREEGLEIRVDTARIFDSRNAHRLLKLAAATTGVDTARAWETVYDEHFRRNSDLGDRGELLRVGVQLGLGESAVGEMLDSPQYAEDVERDHGEALRRGIGSVPTVVVGGSRLSGSHTVEELDGLLTGAAGGLL